MFNLVRSKYIATEEIYTYQSEFNILKIWSFLSLATLDVSFIVYVDILLALVLENFLSTGS
jgi:hypothetical protein